MLIGCDADSQLYTNQYSVSTMYGKVSIYAYRSQRSISMHPPCPQRLCNELQLHAVTKLSMCACGTERHLHALVVTVYYRTYIKQTPSQSNARAVTSFFQTIRDAQNPN